MASNLWLPYQEFRKVMEGIAHSNGRYVLLAAYRQRHVNLNDWTVRVGEPEKKRGGRLLQGQWEKEYPDVNLSAPLKYDPPSPERGQFTEADVLAVLEDVASKNDWGVISVLPNTDNALYSIHIEHLVEKGRVALVESFEVLQAVLSGEVLMLHPMDVGLTRTRGVQEEMG